MFCASASRSETDAPSHWTSFSRDLGASVLTLGALGVLLVAIQGSGTTPETRVQRTASMASQQQQHQTAKLLPRQPSDEAATPDADEERIARAVMAFALSKVSPLQPDPIASIPVATIPPIAAPTASPPRKPSRLQSSRPAQFSRIPAGAGQTGFTQAEWPVAATTQKFSATPKDQPRLVAMTRYVPGTDSIIGGAQSLAVGARKTVSYSVDGLRTGFSAVQERALAVAGKLW